MSQSSFSARPPMSSPTTFSNTSDSMQHVLPYQRLKRFHDFEPETTKYAFEQEERSERNTTRVTDGKTVTFKETQVSTTEKKVILKVYSQSADEDIEHFFEAFTHMQRELAKQMPSITKAKVNNAQLLFGAMEKLLDGTALTKWNDILLQTQPANGTRNYDWEDFKKTTAAYITKKVLPHNAYAIQCRYMDQRPMPRGMQVDEWWARMQTLNRYLPYFIGSMEELKRVTDNGSATFADWWKLGLLGPHRLNTIVLSKVPNQWIVQLEKNDVSADYQRNTDTDTLVEYFGTLQRHERMLNQRKQPIQLRAARRAPAPGRAYNHMFGSQNDPRRQGTYNNYRNRSYQAGRQPVYYRDQRFPNNRPYYRNNGNSRGGGRNGPPQRNGYQQQQRQGQGQYQRQTQPSNAYYAEEQQQQEQNFAIAEQYQTETEYQEQQPAQEATEEGFYGEEQEEQLIDEWNAYMSLEQPQPCYVLQYNTQSHVQEEQFYMSDDGQFQEYTEPEDVAYGDQYF